MSDNTPSDAKSTVTPLAADKDTTGPSPSLPGAETIAAVPQDVVPPKPAPDAPYRQPEFTQRVNALIKGEAEAKEGTEDLVADLKECAQKQDEARQALQQVTQFGQSKQAEIFGLEGQADALMKVLYRAEQGRKA